MTILLVDDVEDVRDLVGAALEAGGYSDVVAVDSAAAAFSFLGLGAQPTSDPPTVDLILLDIVMPDIDGVEACARIRATPRYAEVPIVMTTSLSDMETVDNAFKCGATSYITKPLKAVDLLACVRSTLAVKSELDRRNMRERQLMLHSPFSFEGYIDRKFVAE